MCAVLGDSMAKNFCKTERTNDVCSSSVEPSCDSPNYSSPSMEGDSYGDKAYSWNIAQFFLANV